MTNGEPASLDPSIFEGLARFRRVLRQFLAFSEAAAQSTGVTSQQYQALLVIKVHPGDGIMIRDLADQMLLQHHGAVQLIDRLVSAGLVERKHAPNDGRIVLVILTRKGERLVRHLASKHIVELLKQEPLLAESLARLRQIAR